MKDRATVICNRGGRILLVARSRVPAALRWSLPGGRIRASESPLQAAHRELMEETSIDPSRLDYLFQFGGLAKRHHVFFTRLAQDATAEPCNEISQCGWFNPTEIAALPASVPTQAIVALCASWPGVWVTRPAGIVTIGLAR